MKYNMFSMQEIGMSGTNKNYILPSALTRYSLKNLSECPQITSNAYTNQDILYKYSKGEGGVLPATCHATHRQRRSVALMSPNINARRGWMANTIPLSLYLQEEPQYLF
jgi:hypothetical protein